MSLTTATITLRRSPLPVMPTRRTPRNVPDSTPFGAGILPRTYWTGNYGWIPSEEDSRAAAAMFAGSASEPDWDQIAAERAWEDAYESGPANVQSSNPDNGGTCLACGLASDYRDMHGLCPVCEGLAESASQRSTYAGAGLGWIDP